LNGKTTRQPVAPPLRWARTAYEYLCLCLGYAYFGGLGLLVTLGSAVLYPILPRHVGSRLARSVIGALFRSFLGLLRAVGMLKVDLSALDALRGEHGLVIAPNHPCLLDAVFVISRLPQVACIMKAQIWDNPVLGGGARLAGYIRNDSPSGMIRQAASELQAGHSLLVFPEGTRTRNRPVNHFKGGFALIAKLAGAPVQTVFIETDNPFLSKGWPALRRPRAPLVYRVRLGERFTVTGDLHTFLAQLEDYYRHELAPTAAAPARAQPTPAPADLIVG
jgi:1-acyl-sn-glycerol-3-phosphate acyltransferase